MNASPKLRGAALGLALLTALYLAALAWVDSRTPLWASLPRLAALLPLLAAASLLSYAVRYARWRWLLARAGRARLPCRICPHRHPRQGGRAAAHSLLCAARRAACARARRVCVRALV
jgi:hypothetical protein